MYNSQYSQHIHKFNKGFLTRIGNIHSFANVLEGLFGEYHSSSVALGNVLSSQSQLTEYWLGFFFSLSGRCTTMIPTDNDLIG